MALFYEIKMGQVNAQCTDSDLVKANLGKPIAQDHMFKA